MKPATITDDGFLVGGQFFWSLRGRPDGRAFVTREAGPVLLPGNEWEATVEICDGLEVEELLYFVVDGQLFHSCIVESPWLAIDEEMFWGDIETTDAALAEAEGGWYAANEWLDSGPPAEEIREAHDRGLDRPPEFWLRWIGVPEPTAWMLRGFFARAAREHAAAG